MLCELGESAGSSKQTSALLVIVPDAYLVVALAGFC